MKELKDLGLVPVGKEALADVNGGGISDGLLPKLADIIVCCYNIPPIFDEKGVLITFRD